MTKRPNKSAPAQNLESLKQTVWAGTLAAFPTTLERLVYLASWRDESTNVYWDSELAGKCSEVEANLVLRQVHEEVFQTWLSFSLDEQYQELEQWLKTVKEDDHTGDLATWLTQDTYLKLIPAAAEGAERELYRSDLELVLEALKIESMQSPKRG